MCIAVKASSSGPEFGTGIGLQELWLKYRKLARYTLVIEQVSILCAKMYVLSLLKSLVLFQILSIFCMASFKHSHS